MLSGEGKSASIMYYTMMWMLCALWLVIAYDLLKCRSIHGWRHRKLDFFDLFNIVHDFENICEIILDLASESLKTEKWRNGDKKSSWQVENA